MFHCEFVKSKKKKKKKKKKKEEVTFLLLLVQEGFWSVCSSLQLISVGAEIFVFDLTPDCKKKKKKKKKKKINQ